MKTVISKTEQEQNQEKIQKAPTYISKVLNGFTKGGAFTITDYCDQVMNQF